MRQRGTEKEDRERTRRREICRMRQKSTGREGRATRANSRANI